MPFGRDKDKWGKQYVCTYSGWFRNRTHYGQRFLQELGFKLTYLAENGAEALEQVDKISSLELIVVDWNMPLMNGIEFVRATRQKGLTEVKILMMTTENSMERIVQALASGVDEYIMKPFSKEALQDKLNILGVAL